MAVPAAYPAGFAPNHRRMKGARSALAGFSFHGLHGLSVAGKLRRRLRRPWPGWPQTKSRAAASAAGFGRALHRGLARLPVRFLYLPAAAGSAFSGGRSFW